jgi:fatty acid desaturase
MRNSFSFIEKRFSFSQEVRDQIRSLCEYNNTSAIRALVLDYVVIVLAISLFYHSFWFYPLSLCLIGSRQRALATILHEASHNALTKNSKLNRWFGTYLSGYLIFQTWQSYRKTHVYNHHVRLGDPMSDPDLKHYISSGLFDEPSRSRFIWKFFIRPFVCLNVVTTLKYLLVNRLLAEKDKSEYLKMGLSLAALITVGTYLTDWKFFFLFWLIPYLTTFQIFTWFIELAEHYPIVQSASCDLYASRNRFSHPVEAFFTSIHGENFHLVHHLFPAVPFWNLKKAHSILLQDPDYARVNARMGGIIWSSNFTRSIWGQVIDIKLPHFSDTSIDTTERYAE